MQEGKPYILFCAGEDSGDCIGESLVSAFFKKGAHQFDALGSGGPRMQGAGLCALVEYEDLPVSGFGDVLPKYLKLRRDYKTLETVLANPACKGLVAIDYPGFNMKLVQLAGRLGKPSLYVAPPQVWAWKAKRAKQLAVVPQTRQAVFFEFEKAPYEMEGCSVSRLRHPFAESTHEEVTNSSEQKNLHEKILLMPGSRKGQTLRNIPVFLKIASKFQDQNFAFVAARKSLVALIQDCLNRYFHGKVPSWIQVVEAPSLPQERCAFYRNSQGAISAPGTATLELALSGVPLVVCTKPDALTYALGKRLVRTSYFSLPNIVLSQASSAEFIKYRWNDSSYEQAAEALKSAMSLRKKKSAKLESELRNNLSEGLSSEQLMSEFLAQFF